MKIHTVDWRADAWLGGTSMLGPNEGWLYITIVNLIYSRGGPIEPDKAWLGRVANMHGNAVNTALRRLIELGKIRETGGKLMANGCEKQLETAEKRLRNWVGNGGEKGRPTSDNSSLDESPPLHPSRARVNHQPPTTNISVANATVAEATPADPVRDLWSRGVRALGDHPASRSLLGKMRKEHGDLAVMDAILACEIEAPSEPIAYLRACLRGAKANGRQNPHDAETAAFDFVTRS